MNKKFLAIFVLLSVMPGCWWGSRYRCNPCGPRTTCVEVPPQQTTTCYEVPAQQEETCYEDYSSMGSAGEEYCYEDSNPTANSMSEGVEYCYEAGDYQNDGQYCETDYESGNTNVYEADNADAGFEEFNYYDDNESIA